MSRRCFVHPRRMTSRITIEPGKRSGQPCVRGLRITAWDVLSWLAAGMTEQQILADLYPDSAQVAEVNLLASSDIEVWEFANRRNFVVVSADSDFYELATTIGPPPKLVWLRRWTHPTRTPSKCCGARPSGSPNSRPIPNSESWCWTVTRLLNLRVQSRKPIVWGVIRRHVCSAACRIRSDARVNRRE
jgi:uncharacterized protein (DUF433 family)